MGVRVKTRPFGEIEIDEKQIVDFPEGILGFDYVKRFIILDSHDNSPFKWLQAYSEPELAFVIIRPIDFLHEYELVISPADVEAVEAESEESLLVFAIVTIPTNPKEMTANLQGPIIINPLKRIGKQAVSLSDKYRVKHIILEEMENAAKKG
ncbi:MAG TPA: flagellar assembly protein FliW [Spirochaetota bacterium]|nr:flagellar assembly protein FliW [Spirochaetota bacterium]HQO01776.1 flagellar assembly protein FliW [Spirochaetota bacterium]HQP49476.1 flagellar assembly protein FliW [Spirochaetota bacterium]